MARLSNDVQEIETSFLNTLEAIVREPLTIVFTLISMFAISAKLTLFAFILLPVSGIIISSVSKRLKAKSLLAQQETGNFLSFIEETLTGLKVIKSFTAEKKMEDKFERSTSRLKQLMTSVLNRTNLASPMSEFLGYVDHIYSNVKSDTEQFFICFAITFTCLDSIFSNYFSEKI